MTKELYFVDTLYSKCKTLKTLTLRLYESIAIALDESLVTNIALGFASCYICHSTLISSYIFHTNWWQCFKYYIYILKGMSSKFLGVDIK